MRLNGINLRYKLGITKFEALRFLRFIEAICLFEQHLEQCSLTISLFD